MSKCDCSTNKREKPNALEARGRVLFVCPDRLHLAAEVVMLALVCAFVVGCTIRWRGREIIAAEPTVSLEVVYPFDSNAQHAPSLHQSSP